MSCGQVRLLYMVTPRAGVERMSWARGYSELRLRRITTKFKSHLYVQALMTANNLEPTSSEASPTKHGGSHQGLYGAISTPILCLGSLDPVGACSLDQHHRNQQSCSSSPFYNLTPRSVRYRLSSVGGPVWSVTYQQVHVHQIRPTEMGYWTIDDHQSHCTRF